MKNKSVRRDINKGYIILYLCVLLCIVIGEIVLYNVQEKFSLMDLVKDIIGNLMGVLAAFVVFDIAHEKISRDSYASEISGQILDTMMYHPETMKLYETNHKKLFVNAFIESIVEDDDVAQMLNGTLDRYMLTKEDFENKKLPDSLCRIRTAFSYRLVIDTQRTKAFQSLKRDGGEDPYFYIQEEIYYKEKVLTKQGRVQRDSLVKIGFIFDDAVLDSSLRGSKKFQMNTELQNCIFRERLDIEDEDIDKLCALSKEELKNVVEKMIRPHLSINRCPGTIKEVINIPNQGIVVVFELNDCIDVDEYTVEMIFHIPQRWNSIIKVILPEPTKEPSISLSYNEDEVDVEMCPFMNGTELSAYEEAAEGDNGVYNMTLSGEWVFPMSGIVFPVRRK